MQYSAYHVPVELDIKFNQHCFNLDAWFKPDQPLRILEKV